MPSVIQMQILLSGLAAVFIAAGIASNLGKPPGDLIPGAPRETIPLQILSGADFRIGRQGYCADSIWGVSGVRPNDGLDFWKWNAGLLEREPKVQYTQTVYKESLTAGGRYILLEHYGDDYSRADDLVLKGRESQAEIKRWTRELYIGEPESKDLREAHAWWLEFMHSSAQGTYVALGIPPEANVPEPRYKIRLLDAATLTISDVLVLGGDKDSANCVRRVVPSDDGAYVVVAGWDNGVAMIDVKQKKVLWSQRPPSEVSTTYAVFGPGNEVVYAGGSEGCVYEMAVADGKILGRWFASPTGKSEYGHRISAITLSPDGKYVAAGTGPQGLVFVIEPKTGKTVKVLNHGGSTISLVHFSPDSKRLASFAAGVLKVWQIAPPEPTEAAPVPAPRATPKPGERHDE